MKLLPSLLTVNKPHPKQDAPNLLKPFSFRLYIIYLKVNPFMLLNFSSFLGRALSVWCKFLLNILTLCCHTCFSFPFPPQATYSVPHLPPLIWTHTYKPSHLPPLSRSVYIPSFPTLKPKSIMGNSKGYLGCGQTLTPALHRQCWWEEAGMQ